MNKAGQEEEAMSNADVHLLNLKHIIVIRTSVRISFKAVGRRIRGLREFGHISSSTWGYCAG